ncbi:FAD-binding oxidoreductase [Komagataeibacter xylinus]|uniref:FAD-binding oxidoreductase n=1 Tax=Komagataeibacter xylinus TaxID=28448 RepID=A0A857FNU5_KOMXY|nr:FAD-binding oxidoreductase [Komagataeibacter xylinus]QHC35179.1 FAD-binding oxidoreductase [Komagataeibacter xylinus]
MEGLYEITSPPGDHYPSLTASIQADLAIIGGGLTGLSTAIHAMRAGTETLLLEANDIGYGGSGRNHGHCVPVLRYLNRERAIRILGEERGARYTQILLQSGRSVFSMIRDFDIQCEASHTGALQVADTPLRARRLMQTAAYYASLGVPVRYLGASEVKEAVGSDRYISGWIHPDGGHLNPLALTRGLARGAAGLGVRIYARTPALKIERQGHSWRITTPQGSVTARRVIVASNAYTGKFMPPLGKSFIGLQAYGLASEPLDPALRRKILPGNQSLGDNRPEVRYFRFDKANRLVMGGMVEYVIGVNIPRTIKMMNSRVREVFPELRDIRWRHFWTGQEAVNHDMQPHVYNPAENLFALAGYSGRGVPASVAFGEILALAGTGTAARDLPVETVELRDQHMARTIGVLARVFRGPYNRLRSLSSR